MGLDTMGDLRIDLRIGDGINCLIVFKYEA